MIYLASPYSHRSAAVREDRFQRVARFAAELSTAGDLVYSPIVHGHAMRVHGDAWNVQLPTDWEFWQRHCLHMLAHCTEVLVLALDGWKTSRGVRAELEEAERRRMPVHLAYWSARDRRVQHYMPTPALLVPQAL